MKKLYVLCILLFLAVRLAGIGYDISNSDALRWHRRAENFLTALKTLNLKETYQHYQPGVTLMWVDAAVKQFSTWYQLAYTAAPKTLEMAEFYPISHGISKGVLVAVLAGLLVFQIYCISKLFDKKVALFYVFLISVEPYIIGLNRWFHLTSLEVFFAFSSLLSLLVWYKNKETKKRKFSFPIFLLLSAIFFALSVLSKTSTFMLLPVYLFIFWKNFKEHREYKSFLAFAAAAILTALLVFPALTANPQYVFARVYRSLRLAVTEDPGMFIWNWYLGPFYYLVVLLFKMSPVTLVLSVISIWYLHRTKTYAKNFNIQVFSLVLISYYVFLSLSSKKIDRYSLAFFPYLLLFSSVYLSRLNFKKQIFVGLASLLFLSYVIYVYHPVYSAYYSPLFGGTKTALKLKIYDNSGEYYAQAAEYLNTKGRDVIVYTPNNFDSFSPFYIGKFQAGFNGNTNYAVYSLDSERPVLEPTLPCYSSNSKTGKMQSFAAFGPRNYKVVFVFACR
ncbi:hypothetical protein A3K42_01190 [candidate division WWE3 bacterium RBG_13_37_7]|uniref:Glycosyltransferase RgtA/B/C/D-like domain-containing protein n=1 Tax=candidate division WWE3 bacterium RBG_13_37_7 TaxID=1802609 RepID=A0A1F4U1U4_UNCKA|nr:MAG: hypothetical protein A3K42_01190 [candidate division WWE3 bacterium RBG_13_37_7]